MILTISSLENVSTFWNLKSFFDHCMVWKPCIPLDRCNSTLTICFFNNTTETRQSKHCGFSIYIFDNSKSKSMVRLVRAEKMVLSSLVFARKIARMILIQNIQGLLGPLMTNMAFMPLYMWEMWDVTLVTDGRTDAQRKVGQYSVWTESAITKYRNQSFLAVDDDITNMTWKWKLQYILLLLCHVDLVLLFARF